MTSRPVQPSTGFARHEKRRATFALAMACLFGVSTPLSSQHRAGNAARNANRSPLPPTTVSPPNSKEHPFDYISPFNQTWEFQNQRGTDMEDIPGLLLQSFRQLRKAVLQELRQDNNFDAAKFMISGMLDYLRDHHPFDNSRQTSTASGTNATETQTLSVEERRQVSETIDEVLQAFYARAFASPLRGGKHDFHRAELGIELLHLQLQSGGILSDPFHTVPKNVIVQALAAVTTLQERRHPSRSNAIPSSSSFDRTSNSNSISPDVAFRLLQRLVSGVGIRKYLAPKSPKSQHQVSALYEVDFNRVLNVYSNLGQMDMAHRVIALQERTPHAPSLSPVTYSILVKGYGKLGDWNNIDMLLQHAAAAGDILPDTILFNSFMDAYINCQRLDKARVVFNAMTGKSLGNSGEDGDFPFATDKCPSPNLRSYNTLLKGLAQSGLWEEARSLTNEMKNNLKLWDHVTTNTLVQAAVEVKEFQAAENILNEQTLAAAEEQKSRHHPNADAYTSLIDGYCKNGKLDRAVALIKTMTDRGVKPNEFHFSSLVGGLARQKRTEQARKIMMHVNNLGFSPKNRRPIFNAYISGLVHRESALAHDEYDNYVDDAVRALRDMMEAKVTPDVNSVSVILDGYGNCQCPRVVEATTLVKKLEQGRVIPQNNVIVNTALIRVFAAAGDLEGACEVFRRIHRPDVAAVNAYLDAAVRCGQPSVAAEIFDYYFRGDKSQLSPDVISFSTLINANMKKGTFDGARAARELYEEMKFQRRIFPDKALIDM